MEYSTGTGLNDIMLKQWDQFVGNHPQGSVLQSFAAYSLFEGTANFTPVWVWCADQDSTLCGSLLGVIINEKGPFRELFSARCVVYGGPLIQGDAGEAAVMVQLLLTELIRRVGSKTIFVQFRASYDLSEWNNLFLSAGFQWHPRLNRLVNTSDPHRLWKGISPEKRRQIRKSLDKGAGIVVPENLEQVRAFYDILYHLYRFKVKKPLPDWSFFETFYELSRKSRFAGIFLIKYKERIIGGILVPFFPGKAVFEWYVCGLDEEYKSVGIYPSVLATWAAMDYAAKHNHTHFDFMGVGKPDEAYGVRDFKARFGGMEVNHGRYIRINKTFYYIIAEFGYNLLTLFKRV